MHDAASSPVPTEWQHSTPADAARAFDAGAVHLWLLPLDAPPVAASVLAGYLSDDERARAKRFKFDIHRARFIASHGLLRWLLAAYVSADAGADREAAVDPRSLTFDVSPHGKPSLSGASARSAGWHFNLSHSGDHAAIALSKAGEIGVDIEAREMPDLLDIARANFAPAEFEALLALPDERRADAFLACWTRKEAYVKALGSGLSTPLDRFEVSVPADRPARLLSIEGSQALATDWTLLTFQPLDSCYLSAAVKSVTVGWNLFRP